MIKIFGLFILLGLFSSFCGKSDPSSAPSSAPSSTASKYGEKIVFSQNTPVKFEDFTLTYTGERRTNDDKFPRGFVYHDFKIQNQQEEKTVSWSSGTGDIAPASFQIGGKNYELELGLSDKLGKLAENELVVWKK
jgi:hypothetical protein